MESSIDSRLIHARALAAWKPLADITLADLDKFLDRRRGRNEGPLTTRTRFSWMSSLSDLYDHGVRQGYVTESDIIGARKPKIRPNLPRPIRDDRLHTALEHANKRMTIWLLLAALGGLRVSEIAKLTPDDVRDDHDPWMLYVIGKGNKERMVPVHPVLQEHLEQWEPQGQTLFATPSGKQLKAATVSDAMCRHLDKWKIKDRPHALRHWFATAALEASGGNLRIVQELLGHANPNTTAIYTKLNPERTFDAVANIDF